MRKLVVIFLTSLAVGVGTPTSTQAQGSFRNLDFEFVIPPLSRDAFYQVPIANGLPGWTEYVGSQQLSTVTYNTYSLDNGNISLFGPGGTHGSPFSGDYYVLLQTPSSHARPGNPALAQTGQIPSTANSLTFYADGQPSVTFAGQPITFFDLGSTRGWRQYSGNISAFAGQTGELRFTVSSGWVSLDLIQFSSVAVPEPSTFALGLMGFGVLVGRRLFKVKK